MLLYREGIPKVRKHQGDSVETKLDDGVISPDLGGLVLMYLILHDYAVAACHRQMLNLASARSPSVALSSGVSLVSRTGRLPRVDVHPKTPPAAALVSDPKLDAYAPRKCEIYRNDQVCIYFASSFSFSACFQLLPKRPFSRGTNAPTASMSALRSQCAADLLTKALMPAWSSSCMKYLVKPSVYSPHVGNKPHIHEIFLNVV